MWVCAVPAQVVEAAPAKHILQQRILELKSEMSITGTADWRRGRTAMKREREASG